MNKQINKNIFTVLFLFTITAASHLFALPGVNQYIKDTSGEYVYYCDSSFKRKSFVGFLYYDEGTYAVRYYSPAFSDNGNLLPAKNIELLISMDPTKDYVLLTGERILTSISQEDTDIVNYMHDLIYELTSRRQKAGLIQKEISIEQNYAQFGGITTISFDPLIPLFNIKSIAQSDGTIVFQPISAGMLVSSEDKSFSNFTGFPSDLSDKAHSTSFSKHSKKIEYTYSTDSNIEQSIKLDSQWKKSMDNLFLLGDSAILTMNIIAQPADTDSLFGEKLIRKITLGTQNAYPDWTKLTITKNDSAVSITNTYFQPTSGSITKDFKILTKIDDKNYALFTLTIFAGAYSKNIDYFTKIIKNYSVKN